MKVVVDEGVPRQLVQALRERGISADRFDARWRGTGNGALIALLERADYDVLLTNDKNIADQQSLRNRSIAVVALPLNRRASVLRRVDDIADTIGLVKSGQHLVMEIDGRRRVTSVLEEGTLVQELPPLRPFER